MPVAKLRVRRYRVVVSPYMGMGSPALLMELEHGKVFVMSSIPPDIAIAIEKLANGVDLSDDTRLSLPLLLSEMPEVESVLSRVVKDVVIDSAITRGDSVVYRATVTIQVDGEREVRVSAIPSSAIVLALLSGRDVYVDERLAMDTFVAEMGDDLDLDYAEDFDDEPHPLWA